MAYILQWFWLWLTSCSLSDYGLHPAACLTMAYILQLVYLGFISCNWQMLLINKSPISYRWCLQSDQLSVRFTYFLSIFEGGEYLTEGKEFLMYGWCHVIKWPLHVLQQSFLYNRKHNANVNYGKSSCFLQFLLCHPWVVSIMIAAIVSLVDDV